MRCHVERLAHVRAYRNRPSVGRVGGPVERHLRITVDIPSTLKVVADLWFYVSLVDAYVCPITGKRHELVHQHAVEPWTFRINQRRGWTRGPSAGPKRITGCRWELKDRPNPPDPYVGTVRRQEERGLQVVEPELLVRAWLVGDR